MARLQWGVMSDGRNDVERAAAALASQLPEPLAPLARLAYNYRWCWTPGGDELFRSVSPLRWEQCAGNPVRLLQEAGPEACHRAAEDPDLRRRAGELEEALRADAARDAAPG